MNIISYFLFWFTKYWTIFFAGLILAIYIFRNANKECFFACFVINWEIFDLILCFKLFDRLASFKIWDLLHIFSREYTDSSIPFFFYRSLFSAKDLITALTPVRSEIFLLYISATFFICNWKDLRRFVFFLFYIYCIDK